ncbi:hypothetical protein DRO55_02030 [Candidatus Bathyarchaeota archaeon]|nr:MAG: hypothetical protein DRO55_02030 [Candidatus Bathyarchaeota archaeon]
MRACNMMLSLRGRVCSGVGRGASFLRMGWVREQFVEKFGFEPYPGTLNLNVSREETRLLGEFRGIEITPKEGFRSGRCFRAVVMGKIPGVVVKPEVEGYPSNLLEIAAPICLREELNLKDGDEVEVTILLE